MTHGDDSGLILPPRVAPIQVVIVPIPPRKGDWNEAILPKARELLATLRDAGIRVHLDDRDTQQPGFKYADWEMRGVPVRLEIGPKDVEKQQVVLVRRDNRAKSFVPHGRPRGGGRRSCWRRCRRICWSARGPSSRPTRRRVATYDEFKAVMAEQRGFLVAGWCRDAACEAAIKEETKATVRVHPAGGRAARRRVRPLRQALAARGLLRPGLLTRASAGPLGLSTAPQAYDRPGIRPEWRAVMPAAGAEHCWRSSP